MIYFVLSRNNSVTIKRYLRDRGKSIENRIGIVYYDNLSVFKNLECSTLIFSDFDKLNPAQLREVSHLYDEIKKKYPEINLINDPGKVKLRYALLRSLYESKINPFNVYRLSESIDKIRFPVFLRRENSHDGALSELIYNVKELDYNKMALNLRGYSSKNILAVEYVNVSNSQRIFKKYSALKINNKIFPRQLDYNTHWMVKNNANFNKFSKKEYLAEFESYMQNLPNIEWLNRIFEISGIEYGRIDYGVYEGKPVVWEINLNPNYGSGRIRKSEKSTIPVIKRLRGKFHETLRKEFINLDSAKNKHVQLEYFHQIEISMKPSHAERTNDLYAKIVAKKPIKHIVKNLGRGVLLISQILFVLLRPFGYSSLKPIK